MKQTILQINDLRVQFIDKSVCVDAVRGVNLEIKKGKTIGIIGESGSGKSQTAQAILGLTQGFPGIVGGEILFDGKNLLEGIPEIGLIKDNRDAKKIQNWFTKAQSNFKSIRGKKIALIFQDARASLVPYKTIRQQAKETWLATNENDMHAFENRIVRLSKALNFRDIKGVLESYPNQLSGGESQRAYIMLALLGNPEILIADEPTSSLDPATSSKIIYLLKELSNEEGFSLLLISHNLNQILNISDYLYVFYKGAVIEEIEMSGTDRIEPYHPYTQFLFSMIKGKAFIDLRVSLNQQYIINIDSKNRKGCAYSEICSLKKTLNLDKQLLCESEAPPLTVLPNERKVACWEYEK